MPGRTALLILDRQLGLLTDAIERGSRAARTVWVVHGSHGEAFDEHGRTGHGTELHDEEIHVPFVIVIPGAEPARYGVDAVSKLDIAPTISISLARRGAA